MFRESSLALHSTHNSVVLQRSFKFFIFFLRFLGLLCCSKSRSMNLRCLSPHLDLSSPFVPSRLPSITRYDLSRRRRHRPLELRCQFGFESLFNTLNSVPSLDLLAPVVGLVSSAAALYIRRSPRPSDGDTAAGYWVLFTSPTPFNRSVLLRCPSVSPEDDGVLANSLNDSLVREEQHNVNLSRGRIPLKGDGDVGFGKELKYQRVCVRTDDGGVISMDWPDNLDLEREHGMDTTILIVPGTPEGSMDMKVKLFVLDAIKHGCFPIVMNPRGCAGSALTTTRLFTAADSDDVCTAVQYVNGIRPWTTLMGIGWGYGASMLTKYFCESGETTPVTAAVCIDTPFDLEEYTKSSPHHVALDQKLTSGLREILRANKELFQGKTKGFDVAKALSATSVREFDGALSMISYGFDALEDFYRKSSTRQLIDNLKIPILFIQSDDETVPLFSIPRSSIADNPFTSLLLCSCVHSKINRSNQYALLWSQQLAIEWLSAVEHALLKGRHPLLNDVDITIKPSKGLKFINDGALEKSVQERDKTHGRYDSSQLPLKHNHENVDSFIKPTSSLNVNRFLVDPSNNKVNGHNGALNDISISHRNSRSKFYEVQRDDDLGTEDSRSKKLGTAEATPTESGANAISSEGSQVMQTATVVMNMLDATMPVTLDDEQKKKVLGAMEQGETFMKALQGAVPEDVRGKITTAVAEVMQTQGTNLNLEAFKQIGWIPNMTSELKSKIQGKTKESSPKGLGSDDNPLEQRKVGDSNGDRTEDNNGPSQEKSAQPSGSIEAGSDMEDKANPSNKSDQVSGVTNEDNGEWYKVTEKLEAVDKKRDDGQVLGGSATDSEVVDSSSQQNVTNLTSSEEASSADSSTSEQVPEEGKGSQKIEENSNQDGASQIGQASSNSEEPSSQQGLGSDDNPLEQRKVGDSNGDRTEDNNGPSQEKSAQPSGSIEAGSDMEDKVNPSNKSDQLGGVTNEDNGKWYKAPEKLEAVDKKRDDGQVLGGSATDSEVVDSSSQQNVTNLTSSEEASSADSSTSEQVPEEGKGSQKNEENSNQDGASQIGQASSKSEEPSSPHSSSKSHSISVTQALDALTGFDDSTQMAVNSVFGVIEDMIERLEKRNQENDEAKKVEDQKSAKALNDSPLIHGEKFDNSTYICNESDIGPDLSQQASQPNNPSSGGIESYEDGKNYMGCSKVNFSLAPSSDRYVKQPAEDDSNDSHLSNTNLKNFGDMPDLTLDTAMKRYWLSPYAPYLHRYFPTPLQSQSSLDPETATDLFLDPEEGQWKMLDQPANSKITEGQNEKDQNVNLVSGEKDVENVIKPSYVILDGEYSKFNNQLFHEDDIIDNEQEDAVKEKLFSLIKNTLLDDLRVEVGRRISIPDSKGFDSLLARDLENFTAEVSRGIVSFSDLNLFTESIGTDSVKFGTVEGQKTVEVILSALQDASHLKKVLPFGVIVGSSLASLKTYFQVVVLCVDATKKTVSPVNEQQRAHVLDIKDEYSFAEKVQMDENDLHLDKNKSIFQGHEEPETVGSSKGSIMMGAVTAALGASALGASALFANHQKNLDNKDESEGVSSDFSNKRLFNDDEYVQEKNQSNLVSSLAEKAMSVAGPVVPTKSDGKVDHERLVAILAELGQKGGILRLVGKVALLWGGIRGAMSLTDRLIPLLHIAERPLLQRIFGFVCMVLVLWSPVVIPLLPTLVQSWTTHTPNMIAEFAYIVGLYVASMILVILWGKRIRGYDNPIEQYGLDLTSVPRAFDFLKGLVVGIMLVSCIHSINALLGYASLSWPLGLPSSSSRAIDLLKTYGSILLLAVRGIVSGTGISIVEELLFRSWLAEEVAADLGYYRAIMISGLMFALIQRSLRSIPGFILLSIFLFGIKQRANGKLAAPIGVRTGLLAANFVVQNGNLLKYRADTPFWLASIHPWHPLDGAVGLSLCAILAIFFFPRSQDSLQKISSPIRE